MLISTEREISTADKNYNTKNTLLLCCLFVVDCWLSFFFIFFFFFFGGGGVKLSDVFSILIPVNSLIFICVINSMISSVLCTGVNALLLLSTSCGQSLFSYQTSPIIRI